MEKTLDKIQHSFLIRTLKIPDIEGNFLNFIKILSEKSIANITLNGEELDAFPLSLEIRQERTLSHCYSALNWIS